MNDIYFNLIAFFVTWFLNILIYAIRGLVTSQDGQNDVKSRNMKYLCKTLILPFG